MRHTGGRQHAACRTRAPWRRPLCSSPTSRGGWRPGVPCSKWPSFVTPALCCADLPRQNRGAEDTWRCTRSRRDGRLLAAHPSRAWARLPTPATPRGPTTPPSPGWEPDRHRYQSDDPARQKGYTGSSSCWRAAERRLDAISTYWAFTSQPRNRRPIRTAAPPEPPATSSPPPPGTTQGPNDERGAPFAAPTPLAAPP